ncbi:MAG TPA: FIST N-terminal domain-containing protein [Thermoleophilaceae bacterium]|jgi:hypothetical protein
MSADRNGHASRWCGVGHSTDDNARVAGRQAAAAALAGADPKLLVVFASERYDLHELLASIRGTAPDVPLIGCSTAGEIATSGPGDGGVVVSALGGSGFSIATAASTGCSDQLRTAGAEAAACMNAVAPREHRTLLMLTDGLAGDQQEIIRGAYSVVGPTVPLVGGCAGDDLKMSRTFQLHGDEVLENAVVAAAIASEAPMGIGVRHGWRTLGDPFVVTSSSNARVRTLDDEPALDVYLRHLDAPREAWEDAAAFTSFALTHPLALGSRRDEQEMRFISAADFEERSIVFVADVPQGGLVWLSEGDGQSVLDATDAACGDAVAALGRDPVGVFAFDCIARRGILGDGIKREVERVTHHAAGAPVAGFYTYGEIARTRGVKGFHNQTLVVLTFA